MKIVIIGKDEELKVAGISVFTDRLKKYLISQGHKVYEIRFSNKIKNGHNVIPVKYLLAEKRTFILIPSINAIAVVKENLKRISPDIVYLNLATSSMDLFLPNLCHKLNIPIAAVWHGDFNNSSKIMRAVGKLPLYAYMRCFKQLDMFHVFSKNLKKFFVKNGVDKNKIVVIPNGVDSLIYKPQKSKFAKKNNIKKGIIFLGRISKIKCPEVLINSFLALKNSQSVNLIIVGFGELLEDLKEKYQENKNIIFTGPILNEKVKIDIYNSCQIFVLPSKYEGMSLSLLEAMSCGLACIATDVGANKDTLDNGKAGIIINHKNSKNELTKVLEKILNDKKIQKDFGRKARSRVMANYSLAKILKETETSLLTTISLCRGG